MNITYELNQKITTDELIDVFNRSTLGLRRPVDDRECIQGLVDNTNLLVTARADGLLVGVARSVTDFTFCCYLSCLAVDEKFQKQGIGKELIRRTHAQLGLRCTLILLSAPAAVDYYPHTRFRTPSAVLIIKPGGMW